MSDQNSKGKVKWLVEHILVLCRVIRRQAGASLKFFRKWHLEDFAPSKHWVWGIYEIVWSASIFAWSFMWKETMNLQSDPQFDHFWGGESMGLWSLIWDKILMKNWEKMIVPKSIQDHSRMVQGPSGHQKTSKSIVQTLQKPPESLREQISKFFKKHPFGEPFDLPICQISHAGACVACGGPLGRP